MNRMRYMDGGSGLLAVMVIVGLTLSGCGNVLNSDDSESLPSTNASLADLNASVGELKPAFDPGHHMYTLEVVDITELTVTGVAADENAAVGGDSGVPQDVAPGDNLIHVKITAEDGSTTQIYSVTVTHQFGYDIGDDGPSGGLVFYVDKNNQFDWSYLEAWIADESATYQWKEDNTETPGIEAAIGSGYANTYDHMIGTMHPAALFARETDHGGETDWFLPSLDEYYLMHVNLHQEGLGNFSSDAYWTSSDESFATAWFHGFGAELTQDYAFKTYELLIRVARTF